MLAKAEGRKLYDALHHGDLVTHLQLRPGAFDVIVSADTLCYFGSFAPALTVAWSGLRAGGWLVFTTEASAENDMHEYRLNPHGRYSHRVDHVLRCLLECGFDSTSIEHTVLRMEAGRPVDGLLVAARRPGQST